MDLRCSSFTINIASAMTALTQDLCVDKFTASYISRRLSCEGLHFCTKLLPAFAKHLLLCIEQGSWSDFPSTSIRKKGGLPVIFRGYLCDIFIFKKGSGWILRENPCPVALLAIRQVCEYCYKLALPFEQDQLERATSKFLKTDASVPGVGEYDYPFVESMRKNLETHYGNISKVDVDTILHRYSPKPGPGTYADAYEGKNGFVNRELSRKSWFLRNRMPRMVPTHHASYAWAWRLNTRAPLPATYDENRISELLFVPKDSRGPRTIVREPYGTLAYQMVFFQYLTDSLEKVTDRRINFESQIINRDLAQKSSIDRNYATLDLADASDRVSYAIVSHLARFSPGLRYFIDSGRTQTTKLPCGSLYRLKKLSGMGSGLTFPTMALVIHLAICTEVSRCMGLPYKRVMRHVYVYGDDIIVPSDWYNLSVRALSRVGLEVNLQKSFVKGPFRESCGGDYLTGNDVAPVRLKLPRCGLVSASHTVRTGDKPDETASAILQLERHARELCKKQLFNTAEYFYSLIEKVLGVKLPKVYGESPVLGRYSIDARGETDETGTYKMVKVIVAVPKKIKFLGECPYWRLFRELSQVTRLPGSNIINIMDASTALENWGEAAVPRYIKLRTQSVSSLVLEG